MNPSKNRIVIPSLLVLLAAMSVVAVAPLIGATSKPDAHPAIGREFSFTYLTSQTDSSYTASTSVGRLISMDDGLIIFETPPTNDPGALPGYQAISIHRLIDMHADSGPFNQD